MSALFRTLKGRHVLGFSQVIVLWGELCGKHVVYLRQWFPTFSTSWTVLTISLKAVVGPFNKASQSSYLEVISTRKDYHLLCVPKIMNVP